MVHKPKIGFIGLGNMGFPMAGHLKKADYSVTVCDQKSELAESHVRQYGSQAQLDIGQLISDSEIIITMLPDLTAVKSVFFRSSEAKSVLELAESKLLIDMSSSDPVGTRELGKALLECGIHMIDAPVSGGVSRAKSAELTIMTGGQKSQFNRAEPILQTMGTNIFYMGNLGNGQAMKALNNLCSAAGLLIASEVLIAAMKFGIDSEQVVDVLNCSTGKNNSTENKLKPYILSGSYGSGFSLPLMAKDLASAVHLMDHVNSGSKLAHSCLSLWVQALKDLGSSTDHTEIARWVDKISDGATLTGTEQPNKD